MRSKKISKIIVLSLTFIMLFALVGCGKANTLEELVNSNEDIQYMLDSLPWYHDKEVEVPDDNTINLTYTDSMAYEDEIQPILKYNELEKAKEDFEFEYKISDVYFDNIIEIAKENGFNNVVINVEYYDSNGTLLFSASYPEKTAAKETKESTDSKYASLEEYAESNDAFMNELEEASVDGMEITIEGNSVVYTYTYEDVLDTSIFKELESEIDEEMDSYSSTFDTVISMLSSHSGIEDVTVKVVFLNGDGSVIFSHEYK